MSDDLVQAMKAAYEAGDHERARKLALDAARESDGPAVQRVLGATETDRFLTAVGIAGLGLVAWLVYKYVL